MVKIAKVAVCGMKNIGKTTILEQVIYGNVNEDTEIYPTIEDIYLANIETDRGTKEKLRFYDLAGLESPPQNISPTNSSNQIPKHYLASSDGFILVYDINSMEALDMLFNIKKDIEKNKEKKEVVIIILGNQKTKPKTSQKVEQQKHENSPTSDLIVNKACMWCEKEKLRHYIVNSFVRESLYEPFIHLASRLNPPTAKSSFPMQLSMSRKSIKSADS